MRLKIVAALVALPLAAGANAANLYSGCIYGSASDITVTQLFVLEGDALEDGYGGGTPEEVGDWESNFAKKPGQVRWISGYSLTNFVGQFVKHAEATKGRRGQCFVATSKERALAWFRKVSREGKVDTATFRDWRPVNAGVLAVDDWSGRSSPVPIAEVDEPRPESPSPTAEATQAPSEDAPVRPKKSNAQADAEYEAAMAEYRRMLADQQQLVGEHKRAVTDVARTKAEQRVAAERALTEHQRALEAHAEAVRAQQLEYRKQLARPAGVPNPIYRGFTGPTCELARRSAIDGAGTTAGTRFTEVTTETSSGSCLVQGWWWNTGAGGASRQ